MKAGVIGSLATSSSASCSVAVTLGLAGLSKPRWLSLICTKVKSLPAASALPIRRERGTPPATVQTMAVPAQVMHFRKPRRCKFGSMLMDGLLLVGVRPPAPTVGSTNAARGLFPPRSGIRSAAALYGTRQPAVRTKALPQEDRRRRFELLALPHLDAAFNLARWLAGNTTDAEDVVQDAYLRAYRYFDAFQGGNFRVWLLTIVRNSFLDWLKDNRSGRQMFQPAPADMDWADPAPSAEAMLLDRVDSDTLNTLVSQLPAEYREVLILREIEDLSYKDIAAVTATPAGTVMSRLSRARLALRKAWADNEKKL